MRFRIAISGLLFLSFASAKAQDIPVETELSRKPSLSTHGSCLIRGGTILTVTHGTIKNGAILIQNGKITAIGDNISPPAGLPIIDATGKFITPGIIDAHSHIAADAINEGANSITAEVRILDVLNPQSVSVYRGLSSGVTASLILHGSANAIGGQSAVVKMKFGRPVEEFVVADAPRMIKFALGENVKRSNGGPRDGTSRFPTSRMGVEAVYRRAFTDAQRYMKMWDAYEQTRKLDPTAVPPRRDLRLETVADILRRKIWVQCHCYRQDEMLMMLHLSKEFGFKIGALQHALEAYKIIPEIKASGVGVSTFAGDWAYKIEAFDAIAYNAAMCERAGIVTSVNSDNMGGTYRLNLEAAKCRKYGGLSPDEALRLITINPAIQIGIDHRTGSLDIGKDGDIAIWDGHPLSAFSKCVTTLVEGEVFFQRNDAFHVDPTSTTRATIPACAVDPLSIPLPRPANVYAIVGATIHPVTGPDIPDGVLVMTDGRIKSVGAKGEIPRGAVVINAKGLHVYPGLIDAGSHLGLTEIDSINATVDSGEGGEFQPDMQTLTAVNPSSEHFPVTRVSGIAAAQTAPTAGGGFFGGGGLVLGQGSVIDLAGWTPDQMKVQQATALYVNYPEPLSDEIVEQIKDFLPADEVERRQSRVADQTKLLKDYFEQAKRYSDSRSLAPDSVAVDPRLEAMRPYVTGKKPVIFEVNSVKGIRAAVKFAEDNKVRIIIGGGEHAWRLAPMLAQKKIPVIYGVPMSDSLGSAAPGEFEPYDTLFAAPALMQKAGVMFCFESNDAATARNLPGQVGLTCAFGLTPDQALKAMTIQAAEILGVADQLGSLEPGKIANVLVTDGDPLEITTDVHRLFIAGRPVSLETKHSRLYKLYSQRNGSTGVTSVEPSMPRSK